MGTSEPTGVPILSSSSSDLKSAERDMWDNIGEWSTDPRRNPVLLGWYSFCQVMAEMALPALERLADPEHIHGFPVSMYPEGVVHHEATAEQMEAAGAKWAAILAHIRDAFRQIVASERGDKKPAFDPEFVGEGLRLFGEHFMHLWD